LRTNLSMPNGESVCFRTRHVTDKDKRDFLSYVDCVLASSQNWEICLDYIQKDLESIEVLKHFSAYEIRQSCVYLFNFAWLLRQTYKRLYYHCFSTMRSTISNMLLCKGSNEIMTTKIIKYYYCCASSLSCGNELPSKPSGASSWFPTSRKYALN